MVRDKLSHTRYPAGTLGHVTSTYSRSLAFPSRHHQALLQSYIIYRSKFTKSHPSSKIKMEPMSPIGEDEKSAPPAPAVDVETGLTGGDDVPPRGDVGPAPRPRLAAIQASSGPSLKNVLSSSGPSLKNVLSRPLTRRASIHDTTTFDDLRRSLSSGTTGASTNFRSVRNAGGKSDDDVDVHSRMLSLAIENACHSAYGIIGVDVWIYDEDDGSFHHAPGGYHRHYLYEPEGFKEQMALRRIEDETLANYVPPTKQVPGAGLAGYFW